MGFVQNTVVTPIGESYRTGRRVALAGIGVSAMLACSNIIIGLLANSTSVVATGFEFAGDVIARRRPSRSETMFDASADKVSKRPCPYG